ncbi:MAG: DNA polymerase/3'-5' exonuclease PolX [Actinomycetota bacterium]
MTNQEVASRLDDIGDMLEILGDNPFRVRAHHRAANSIRSSIEDVGVLVKDGRLTELPAVGERLAERIAELLTTGKMAYYEDLKTQVPPRLLELMSVPGVGPKKAKLFYEELRITDVDELMEAAREGRVSALKGMNAKTEENIIKGIELLRVGRKRMLLSEAYPAAKKFVDAIRTQPGVADADYAGSLRRMKETIGDIDILAAGDDTAAITGYFTGLPDVERVLARGDTKASVLTGNGLQVDLRVVKPAEYGSALQYFTGSKEHNVRLRDMAKKRGLKISEYGIFDLKTGRNLGSRSEADVYGAMGLDYIDPEIREDLGEIKAAEAHALPKLVAQSDIRGDLQVHSTYSDGLNHIADLAGEAKALGYEYIAITDHAEKLKIAGGMTREDIKKRRAEIERLNSGLEGIVILSGIELNIAGDGGVDYPDEILKEFDIVLASIHSGFSQPREKIMKRVERALANPYIQIFAHPTGRVIGRREPYAIDIEAAFDLAADTGTIMEINAFPDRLDLRDDYIREAKRRGLKLVINTDSHMAAHLRYMMYGVAQARRGWLEPPDVVNTLPLDKMLAALKNKP